MDKALNKKHKAIGNLGEAIAAKYLISKGYAFVEKNFHAQGGEIDLIFKQPNSDFYIFVEVKTRRNNAFGDIKESINKQKIQKIMCAIEDYFLKKHQRDSIAHFRVDAVFVQFHAGKAFCEHLENLGFGDF